MSGAHVVPRSVVFRIVPASPTMKPVPDPRRCAPFKLFVVPELTGDHWPNALKPQKKPNHNVRSTVLPLNITYLPLLLTDPHSQKRNTTVSCAHFLEATPSGSPESR